MRGRWRDSALDRMARAARLSHSARLRPLRADADSRAELNTNQRNLGSSTPSRSLGLPSHHRRGLMATAPCDSSQGVV